MRFQPMTKDEIETGYLLPDGLYDFEVTEATDQQSKQGNDMLKLRLKVYKDNGGFVTVYDYLLEKMKYKLVHFCREAGLENRYESGELTAAECVGRTGKVYLVIERQEGYSPKNTVKDYGSIDKADVPKGMGANAPAAVRTTQPIGPAVPVKVSTLDDDAPF